MPEVATTEPMIYVMPERFYAAPGKGLSAKMIFIMAVSALFVLVVGGATWYFTGSLRQPVQESAPIAVVEPSVPTEEVPPAQETPTEPEVPASAAPTSMEETPMESEQPTPETPVAALSRGQDTDSDGLTDLEEELFSTNSTLPDTDGDGYLDGHEAFYLYNPAGIAPERLEDAGLATRFENSEFFYEILFPAKWKSAKDDGNNGKVSFQSATGEYIAVMVKENKENLSLEDWLKNQVGEKNISDLQPVTTRSGMTGLISNDKTTAYFLGQGVIFAIYYDLAGKSVMEYTRVFEMMVNSLALGS
ncbi:MAG: hypothetical protein Q8M83_06105 [bacterium]|nr:hypothetical protein [bacterium]